MFCGVRIAKKAFSSELCRGKKPIDSFRFFSSLPETKEMTPTLVTIPASNYAEKARWALRATKIQFIEEKWPPLLAYLSTIPKGGRSVPLLTVPSPKVTLTDSADIMAFCAKKDPSLYPNAKTKDLEKFYDSKLGPHTRRCAYFLMFQDAQATKKLMTDPIDGIVLRSVTKVLYPVLSLLVTRGMNINEKAAERSWSRIENILEEIEEKLGDGPIGSRFLAGDTFSAADIAFCSHVALLVLPPELEYIAPHFSLDMIKHPGFRDRLVKLQHSKIGQFVRWCYSHKRM